MTRTYDAADRILTETNAMDGVTRYDYDAAGNVIRVTDPEQHSAEYEYDAMNRRTAVIAANGARTETDYTLRGDVVAVTNANQHSVRRTLDKLGRTLSSTDANGYRTDYRYDANGNLTCTIDANATAGLAPNPKNSDGCTVSHVYDELNRVILSRDAMNGTTQTRYDLLGNILSITDAMGRTTGYQYDGLGRLILSTDPLGKVTRYKRDEAGNAWEMTNRLGEVTRISYDALNRPTRYDYLKDNSADTLHYDPAGNLESQGNATVSYRYRYDALNRMESKQDSRGRSLGFAYDAASQLLAKTTYQNSTTHYRYDSSGTLTGISNPDYLDVHYHYDPAGRLQSRVMSSGATSTYQYDNNGQTTRISHRSANGQGITDISYTRDRVGNILSQTDSSNTGTPTSTPATTNYTYDALYRLIQVDAPGTADDEAWQYDAVGNRLSHTTGGLSINASGSTTRYYNTQPNSNRLVDIRLGSSTGTIESAYQYDDEGRLTRQTGKRPRTLLWDAQGRLASLTQGGHTETYAYDPLDHRIKRSGGSASQASAGMPTGTPSGPLDYYLEGEHLDSVEDANRQPRETYFRGSSIDELVAGYVVNGTTTPNSSSPRSAMLYQHDGTMSVIAISGVNGQLLQSNRYRPFGSSQSQTGSQAGNTANRLQYTGRENDGTGLYYYRARYYDPEAGRFLSEDPLGFAAGDVNFYAYVGNNPVNANDPTGMVAGDIYTVTPATKGFWDIVSTNANLLGQRLLGATGKGYVHAAIEIGDNNGQRRIAESEPSGLRIRPMSEFITDNSARGSTIDRYIPKVAATQSQIKDLTDIAKLKEGTQYNWAVALGVTDRSNNKFSCADFCDYAAKTASMPGINSLDKFGASPLPSHISRSLNYIQQPLDIKLYPSNVGSQQSGKAYAKPVAR